MRLGLLKSKKLFAVLRNLIIAEILAYLAFIGLALSNDWGKMYEDFIAAQYIPFAVAEFSLLGIFQVSLIFFIFYKSIPKEDDVNEMIKSGENENLEFKASLRWDFKRNQVNKELEKIIMKTITAFLNSEGGHLIIGVDDKGQPMGLDKDFTTLGKSNPDGFENHFNNIFNTMVGPEFRRLVKLTFNAIDNKTICIVNVAPSHQPAYMKDGNGENFYIRTGNVTTPLKMSEAATYISSWWEQK